MPTLHDVIADAVRTPDKLRTYVESQPEGTMVGFTGHPRHCPLATFINAVSDETGESYHASVATTYARMIGPSGTQFWVSMPDWVRPFIKLVDSIPHLGPDDHPVTREEALAILAELPH